jgi:hypothetical protein
MAAAVGPSNSTTRDNPRASLAEYERQVVIAEAMRPPDPAAGLLRALLDLLRDMDARVRALEGRAAADQYAMAREAFSGSYAHTGAMVRLHLRQYALAAVVAAGGLLLTGVGVGFLLHG